MTRLMFGLPRHDFMLPPHATVTRLPVAIAAGGLDGLHDMHFVRPNCLFGYDGCHV